MPPLSSGSMVIVSPGDQRHHGQFHQYFHLQRLNPQPREKRDLSRPYSIHPGLHAADDNPRRHGSDGFAGRAASGRPLRLRLSAAFGEAQ